MWYLLNIAILVLGLFDWWSTTMLVNELGIAETNKILIPIIEAGLFTPVKLGIHITFFILIWLCLKNDIEHLIIKLGLIIAGAEYLYVAWNNGQILLWWWFRTCPNCPLI